MGFFVKDDLFLDSIELKFTDSIEETSTVQLGSNSKFRITIRTVHEQNLYEGHYPSLKIIDGNKYHHDGMKGITVYYKDPDNPNSKIGVYPAQGKQIQGKDQFEFLDFFIKTNYESLMKIWKCIPGSDDYISIMNQIIKDTGKKFKKYKIVVKV